MNCATPASLYRLIQHLHCAVSVLFLLRIVALGGCATLSKIAGALYSDKASWQFVDSNGRIIEAAHLVSLAID